MPGPKEVFLLNVLTKYSEREYKEGLLSIMRIRDFTF